MKYVSGLIYTHGSFMRGYLGFEDGIIQELGRGTKKDVVAKGIVIPAFVNAHTHLGDAGFEAEPQGSLQNIVGPGGMKFRFFSSTSIKKRLQAMKNCIELMYSTGTGLFCDFREEGVHGVAMFHKALRTRQSSVRGIILGRPRLNRYNRKELDCILAKTDGIGISSLSDWDYSELEKVAFHVRTRKKLFSMHASEAFREDIDKVLALKPSFLVHMTFATRADLERCAAEHIPIVLCPRTAVFFGNLPPLKIMFDAGILLSLGTDNVMLNAPSMFRELEFTFRIARLTGGKRALDILKLSLDNGRKTFNCDEDMGLIEGSAANFLVLSIAATEDSAAYSIIKSGCESRIVFRAANPNKRGDEKNARRKNHC